MKKTSLQNSYQKYHEEPSIFEACNKIRLSDFDYPDRLLEYTSFQEKSNFFSQIFVETEEKFYEVFHDFNNRENLIFRGLSEAKYSLYNSLQRNIIPNKREYHIPYKKVLLDLMNHLKEAQSGIILKYFLFQGIDNISDLALFSFLQHHGCATPLLDWTYSFEKSLYFGTHQKEFSSSRKEIENYFSIYVIHLEIAEQLNPIVDIEKYFTGIAETTALNKEFYKSVTKFFPDEFNLAEEVEKEVKNRARNRYFSKRIHSLLDTDLLLSNHLIIYIG